MSNMNLSFDDGFREFTINNDPNRIIRFNPTDISILERFNEARKTIEQEEKKIKEDIQVNTDGTPSEDVDNLDTAVATIASVNQVIREQTDYIFNYAVSDAAYGKQSPLSMINGSPLFEGFLNAALMHITKEVEKEQEKSKSRISKYTQTLDHKKKQRKPK